MKSAQSAIVKSKAHTGDDNACEGESTDIIFNEIAIERYGSIEDMKNALDKLPEKRKHSRQKKAA